MKLNQIITSLLETDMYKFSMGEAIYHQFSDYKTTWTFKCRNTDVHFTAEMVQEIKEQIKAYCSLRFTEEELELHGSREAILISCACGSRAMRILRFRMRRNADFPSRHSVPG